jgi:16S rRNA U516 pseudouridylate synthase RsuA-like enzyme
MKNTTDSPEMLATAPCSAWRPIETLDRSKMDFVLVTEDGAVRLHLWNPKGYWERAYPIGSVVGPCDDCANPTHWMPCPDAPNND